MNLRKKTQEIVGSPYRHALFYNFPGGLRFELSTDGSPLDQVLTALRKATVICDDIFSEQENLLVHLITFAPMSRFGLRNKLRELQIAGISIPKVREIWLSFEDESEEDDGGKSCWICCAFELPVTKLQNLIWCAITGDFGSSLRPNPHCRVYMLHVVNEIVVHPYDDRGMDVISRNPSALTGLYQRHNDLLLDFDIGAMRKTFTHA